MMAKRGALSKLGRTILAVAPLVGLSFLAGWLVRGWQLGPDVGLMAQVHDYLLTEAYPMAVPTGRELSYAAARSMLDEAADPYSALIVPPMSYRVQNDVAGETGILGLYAEKHSGEMVVEVVQPGEAADQAGILPGDVILSIDGVQLDEAMSEMEATLLMRGPVGETAQIVVRRGDQTVEFAPVREPRPKISSQMIGDVGYLYQHTFTTDTAALMKDALENLLDQQPRAIIWDLRSNGGGSMDTTQTILSYFIEEGPLFTAELSRGRVREFTADKRKLIDAKIPLVVLIGERTYSAAETAAAAISERGRGVTMGSNTYGKGTINATIPLANDSLLQLTIAKWLSPSGQWYNGRGVAPDIPVEDDPATQEDEVLQYALDYILQGKAALPHTHN
jgi:carboxyl-terminal processing protease